MHWNEKRFYSLDYFFKTTFAEKIIKISLDAGLTCPNRDGKLSYDGCIFCSQNGSGDFTENKNLTITNQFESYREKLKQKWPSAKYIAYFQSFTNTYGDIDYLKKIFYESISIDGVKGISIATRPDCLSEDVLSLLSELTKKTFVFVELGFQTSNPQTVKIINRLYDNEIFENAVSNLKKIGVNVVCHLIVGLPGETKQDVLNSVKYVTGFNIDGIKLHLLHVLKSTFLSKMYYNNSYKPLQFDEYIDIIVACLEIIPQNIVIHRLTGDGPKESLIAPLFSLNKKLVLNTINKKLKENDTWQGKFF